MAAKPKILIIDDNLDTVELLRKRFRAEGFDTDEAYDGVMGLETIRTYDPDLILLDIMMPKMDGYEVCEVINNDEAIKHIPKIMLTAKSKVPDKVRGFDIGADDYITKPFDFKEVVARVRSLLAKKLENTEIAEQEKFEALDHFLDEVSHEVRNPLVTIGGFARRVKKNLPEGSKNYQDMDIILQNVEVLEKMVHKLISLRSANLCYRESSNINEIVSNALSTYHQEIENKKITLVTDFMDNPPIICADQENITMTIAHIIENAIEAMVGEKRVLTISTDVKDRYFEIEISDTGKGIEKSKIKNIYDPFFSSKTYGPGFGLTFALKTVRSHNGIISVESTENQGSTFTIKLPMRSVVT
ncbi:MAG: response regulator [Proteobacteria bacterium]|nr:response regulator [Pseudomonadota bacterium]MBU1139009.1 response regulator [Pseudomonadota bacterium]MBU1454124.1 response regulator [Pseudomonadota bacterium]